MRHDVVSRTRVQAKPLPQLYPQGMLPDCLTHIDVQRFNFPLFGAKRPAPSPIKMVSCDDRFPFFSFFRGRSSESRRLVAARLNDPTSSLPSIGPDGIVIFVADLTTSLSPARARRGRPVGAAAELSTSSEQEVW